MAQSASGYLSAYDYGSIELTPETRERVRRLFTHILADMDESGTTQEMWPPYMLAVHYVLRSRKIAREMQELGIESGGRG
jgi:class 3 adenylate cyclase